MRPRWELGDAVRVTRNVRNDGTFPGVETGDLLVRRGRIGHVRDVGTFLQDQVIYSVHFLDEGRVVGCREEELIDTDEPWIENRFEVRQKVRAASCCCSTRKASPPPADRPAPPARWNLRMSCAPWAFPIPPHTAPSAFRCRATTRKPKLTA
jgi:hypothetical protein